MSADSYVGALRGLGVEIIAAADLGYYQGDWVGLVAEEQYSGRFGFLVIGYGSCSGCDDWEAAETAAKRAEIMGKLLTEAKWFDDFDEAQAYVTDPEGPALQWYAHEDGWPAFVEAVKAADEWTRVPAESAP